MCRSSNTCLGRNFETVILNIPLGHGFYVFQFPLHGIGFYCAYEIIFQHKLWGSRLAWSRLVDLGSIDSGSNPESPTNQMIRHIF